VEKQESGVSLTQKRRYAHGEDHLREAASAAGFAVLDVDEVALRIEGGQPVSGLVFVLRA
jgi:predicted TPR repeat methyltransferase